MTAIQWTDQTWNPVRGCSRVSPGCENCYAERMAGRLVLMGQADKYGDLVRRGKQGTRWTGRVAFDPETLAAPLSWRKPRRVFVNSMSDLFHEALTDEQIAAVFGVMAATPQHTYQVLTKRAERMARWFAHDGDHATWCGETAARAMGDSFSSYSYGAGGSWPLPNVWIGVSVEDQQRADERIPHLLRCPAAVRFLSVEPMIGALDLRRWFNRGLPSSEIHWTICGGESGPGARPCDVAWIRSLVEQCKAAAVPVFVKQLGAVTIAQDEYDLGPMALRAWEARHAGEPFPQSGVVYRLRNRKGGDLSEWPDDIRVRQFPTVTP